MAKITDIQEVLVMKLQGLYDMEKEIEAALPDMKDAATNPKLKEGFKMHLEETKMQIARLEEAFALLSEEPEIKPHEGIRGLIADGAEVIDLSASAEIKDAMLAGAARHVEHYEMAGYMGAVGVASAAGNDDIGVLLMKNLAEEQGADEKLKMVAQESLGMLAMK